MTKTFTITVESTVTITAPDANMAIGYLFGSLRTDADLRAELIDNVTAISADEK